MHVRSLSTVRRAVIAGAVVLTANLAAAQSAPGGQNVRLVGQLGDAREVMRSSGYRKTHMEGANCKQERARDCGRRTRCALCLKWRIKQAKFVTQIGAG